jgi:hypothetical protein
MALPPTSGSFRYSLKWTFALVTLCAIVVNFALARPTGSLVSIARLMIAAGFLAGGSLYLIMRSQGWPRWQRFARFALWSTAGLGCFILLSTASILLGSALFQIFAAPE